MPVFDDDDDSQNAYGYGNSRDDHDSWDVAHERPDDIVPDELDTVRCGNCRKMIFEDSVRCPYCKHLQLEDERNRKPLWFVITVVLCILAMTGVVYTIYSYAEHHHP
jgi:hypothetical protein